MALTPAYTYACTISRWIDGDTAEVVIDVGFYLSIKQVVRLYGINTPELHSRDKNEREAAKAARDYAAKLAPMGSECLAATVKPREKFGRFLANLTTPDGTDVAAALITAGLGVAYTP